MGQKVNPHGLRVGVIKDWDSKWYAGKDQFADYLAEDHNIRTYIKKKLYSAGVSHIIIERSGENKMRIVISTARPGMVIGRSGAGIDQLKADLEKMTDKKISISIEEVRRSEMDAQLTAESVAEALEHRISFRRAMKQAIGRTMKSGAKGIKILCSGRLGGAEIARKEQYSEGNVPLHTLRADIDYGFAEADTTYGRIGVKVWINHGEILDGGLQSTIREEKREGGRRDRRGRRDDRRGRRKFDRRDDHRAAKAVNPRKRKTPKAAPKAEQAEAAPAETQETNE
ncbi:MAG: 30S ribosomal protein S3 [Eubacterium sp.]|jgi:small subunit ribosomal protein S3|nr:30S ribosomal protein S3 [Eubacterium sp.]MCH4046755.1 30S ribosomal protein S3 [Eubacterium sp.]MCH4079852.1 30S ribosomal protein S3 [Eubacterium sp.]MCH4110107.1 30S ribosomal protein S3 [Eubacterium sp.]MCI1306471.1 30S ribosomal protein S3 [Eubacterium sp.]